MSQYLIEPRELQALKSQLKERLKRKENIKDITIQTDKKSTFIERLKAIVKD